MKKIFLIICFINICTIPAFSNKMRLAVLDFKADGVSRAASRRISELIRVNIINNDNVLIIERAQMGKILAEQGFQQTGCVEVGCAVKVGKILSANKILVGTVMKLGKSMVITARVVDVEKGISEFSHDRKIESEDKLYENVKEFSKMMSSKISKQEYKSDSENIEELKKTAEIKPVEKEDKDDDRETDIDETTGPGISKDYVNNGDGTIYDKKTGLTWSSKLSGKGFNYSEALSFSDRSRNGNLVNWRLPTRKELERLLPSSNQSTIAYLKKLGFKNIQDYYYWTSSEEKGKIWILEMSTDFFELSEKRNKYRVIMVSDRLE